MTPGREIGPPGFSGGSHHGQESLGRRRAGGRGTRRGRSRARAPGVRAYARRGAEGARRMQVIEVTLKGLGAQAFADLAGYAVEADGNEALACLVAAATKSG